MNPNAAKALLIVSGLALTAAWVAGAIVIATMSLMGTLMANDAGNAPASSQTTMVLMVLGGQILAGAAGIPAGLACFWRSRRKFLLILCATLIVLGVLAQAAGIYAFTSSLRG